MCRLFSPWSYYTFYIISLPGNLLRCDLKPNMWFIWVNALQALKNNVYSNIISYIVLYKSIRSGLLISRNSILHYFFQFVYSDNHWKHLLNFPFWLWIYKFLLLILSTFTLYSLNLGAYSFRIVIFWWINPFSFCCRFASGICFHLLLA